MQMLSSSPGTSSQTRLPQSGQKTQTIVRPLSAARGHLFTAPRVGRKSARRAMTEMPKAEDDCLRHSRQW